MSFNNEYRYRDSAHCSLPQRSHYIGWPAQKIPQADKRKPPTKNLSEFNLKENYKGGDKPMLKERRHYRVPGWPPYRLVQERFDTVNQNNKNATTVARSIKYKTNDTGNEHQNIMDAAREKAEKRQEAREKNKRSIEDIIVKKRAGVMRDEYLKHLEINHAPPTRTDMTFWLTRAGDKHVIATPEEEKGMRKISKTRFAFELNSWREGALKNRVYWPLSDFDQKERNIKLAHPLGWGGKAC